MSRECVVVASATGGQQEVIVDKESGFVCESAKLGETIDKASRQSIDARRAMGKAARERVAQWTNPDVIYDKKMEFLQSMANRPSPTTMFPVVRPRSQPPAATTKSGLLSIVVPFYNLGSYIFETLDSLMKVPANIPKEIIVVDDGSTDGVSIAALRKAAKTYPNTTIYRTVNQGLAQARNFGAAKSSGTFLSFLDADDTVDPRYYVRALQILQHYDNLSFVGCWAQYFGADRHIWPTWNPEPPYALFHNPLNTSALVYLREHFLAYGQNDSEMEYGMEDYESLIRMLDNGCYGASIPEPYFHYRVRRSSMSRAFNPANQQYLYRLIVQKNPSIYAEYAQDLVFLFNANGPQFLIDSPSVSPPAYFKLLT
jgi:glycosyltransferase involved in cell wall biosynthesis